MNKRAMVAVMILVLALVSPALLFARTLHLFPCANCHRGGYTFTDLKNGSLCMACHNPLDAGMELNDGYNTATTGRFIMDDGSNALGSNPSAASGPQTSHMWGVTEINPAAGAQLPTVNRTQFDGRYGISRGSLACSRCHNPHGDNVGDTTILKLDNSADGMCVDCHLPWATSDPDAFETHPIVADYDASVLAAPANFNALYNATTGTMDGNVGQGDVRLVFNASTGKYMVSCTSCHGVHFTDSDSTTADGLGQAINQGDGHLLRTDGPRDFSTATSADFTEAEATKRSAVCQACHAYQIHGNSSDGGTFLGCSDCHSGHSHNNNDPFYYVLRKTTFNPIPAYNAAVTFTGYRNTTTYIYNSIDSTVPGNKTGVWNDGNIGTTDGYCEACHGDAKDIPKGGAGFHTDIDNCTVCHLHNKSGWTYSFENDASAASCGDCHGFPPYKNIRGDRLTNATYDGGYAYESAAWNYNHASVTYFKDESQTAHNAHAGGGTAQAFASTDYIFGGGVSACKPCHDNYTGTHQEQATTPYATGFRDVNFLAEIDLGAGASYNTGSGVCSNVYCHSNGAPRSGDGPARNYTAGTVDSPPWENGRNALIGQPGECNTCHGNTSLNMPGMNNTAAHVKHLTRYGEDCSLCHNDTATSNSALKTDANLVDVSTPAAGGTHVNTLVDIVYASSGSALYNAVGLSAVGENYNSTNGTCSVYCHDPANLGSTADWDDGVGGAPCGSCHAATAATLATNSHDEHLAAAGANISCDSCHGLDAVNGNHGGHVDGVVTFAAPQDPANYATVCTECHGIEQTPGTWVPVNAWDTDPEWGNSGSVDCRTCHTGGKTTAYTDASSSARAAVDQSAAYTAGHNATAAYTLTGNSGAAKLCADCHVSSAGGHVGGGMLLQGTFDCGNCHDGVSAKQVNTHTAITGTYTLKNPGITDFTLACLACHDPHGSGNGAMIWSSASRQSGHDARGVFSGDVVFSSRGGTSSDQDDSYDESGDTVPNVDNGDDICATCHTITDHNRQDLGGGTHHENETCTTVCHTHGFAEGGFMAAGGDSCDSCHANPPTAGDDRPAGKAGAHAAHVRVATDEDTEDKFDCDVCHPGAATFGYIHGAVPLAPGISNTTCANACHVSTLSDGYWTDPDGLNCDSCHYYADPNPNAFDNGNHARPLSTTHGKHFDSGRVCTDCHADNTGDAGSQPLGRVHISSDEDWSDNDTNDGTVLQDRGTIEQDEATVIVATWDDGTDTCSNSACHNPSGDLSAATWGTTNLVGCAFCHSDSDPGTGSHSAHMDSLLGDTFGRTLACTECHVNNGVDTAHLSGAVDFNGTTTYNSTNSNCTASLCHQDGKGGDVDSPVWGNSSATVCATCHNDGGGNPQPATGRHGGHVGNANYVAGSCGECHLDATPTAITAASHLNGSVQAGDAGIALTDASGLPQCANTCHNVDATGTWTDGPATLDCIECHTAGKIGTAPASGLHTGTLTVSGNTHDVSFQATRDEVVPSGTCTTCHTGIDIAGGVPAAHIAGGAPSAAEAALDSALSYVNGSPSTCAPTGGLAACHDDGGAWSRRWSTTARDDATPLNECANCHGDFDNPLGWTSGVIQRHSLDPQVIGGHNGTDKCYICHTFKAGDVTYYNSVTMHRDSSIQLNDGMEFTDDGDTVHCTGCHTGVPLGLADGQYSFQDTYNSVGTARWGRTLQPGPAASCTDCHENVNGLTHGGPNDNLSVHTAHTGSPLTPGCSGCHPHAGPGTPGEALHINNFVDFGGTYLPDVGYTYNVATENFTNTNCSADNGCHNSEVGSWAGDSIQCIDCHAASSKAVYINEGLSGWPVTSDVHSQHTGNDALVPNDCDDCHGAGSSDPVVHNLPSGHSNDSVTFNSAEVVLYNATDGTCDNTCHYVAEGNDWTSGTGLNCADCHDAANLAGGARSLDQGGWPITSAKHAEHIGQYGAKGNYVSGGCADCHGLDAETGGHGTHQNAAVDTDASLSYNSGTKTCTNSCHVANTTDDWTSTGSLACRDCHDGGHVAPAPATGLHTVSVATTHDETLQGGNCINCHDATAPSTSHIAGGAAQGWAAGLYNFNANVASYNSAVGCAADCHGDRFGNGGTGKWSRKWIGVEDDTPDGKSPGAAVCGNCHGDFVSGWRAGITVSHVNPYAGNDPDDDMNQHSGCEKCHGWNNANYDETYGGTSPAHGDGNITMNGPASTSTGAGYNSVTGGCTQACHGEEYVMLPTDSGWTENYGDFGGGDCDSCHAGNAPPRDHGDVATENATTHNLHATSGLVGGCTACHPHNGSVTPGTEPHGTGTVNFTNQMAASDDYTVSGFEVSNCSTNNCHVSDSGDWTALSNPLVCSDCHNNTKALRPTDVYPPTSGRHTMHIDNDTYVTSDCAPCHGAGAETGDHSGHRSGGAIDTVVSYLNGTCTNTCHNASLTDNWTSVDLLCADCHDNTGMSLDVYGQIVDANTAPTTGRHDFHMNQVGAKGNYVPNGCSDCHGHDGVYGDGTDVHLDGSTTVGGVVTSYNSTQATCVNSCHVADTTNDWSSGGSLACDDCHNSGLSLRPTDVYPPNTAKHGLHMGQDGAKGDYVPNGCSECHGTDAMTGGHLTHKDGAIDTDAALSYNSGTKTCTNTCHLADTTDDWTLGATLACADCHDGAGHVGQVNKDNASGLHIAGNATQHDESSGVGITCTSCHDTMPAAGTHKDGFTTDPVGTFGLFAGYNSTNSDCAATCHDDEGQWRRLWNDAVDADPAGAESGSDVCNNCHGQYSSLNVQPKAGWREGTVHYRSGAGTLEDKGESHNKGQANNTSCNDCHAYDRTVSVHQDGNISFSGNDGSFDTYELKSGSTGWYCSGASCHDGNAGDDAAQTDTRTFLDSLTTLPRAYVLGNTQPEGSCTTCHGNATNNSNWPDDSTAHAVNDAGAHPEHVHAIAAELYNTASPTVEQQNTTCDYCHPTNTHEGGVDGGDNVADVTRTDTNNDNTPELYNSATMKYIIGGSPDNGVGSAVYHQNEGPNFDGRCSLVDCHANAPYTPGWYGDSVEPSSVTLDPAVAEGSRTDHTPGTVELTWNAPGDDNGDDGTAYQYDVRYRLSTNGAVTDANWNDGLTMRAGHVPSVDRMGKQQRMIVDVRNPDQTYEFAVKTSDEAGNWSVASNSVPGTAHTDDLMPVFWGISKTEVSDETGTVDLYWDAARDHTLQINYRIWWSTSSLKAHELAGRTLPDTDDTGLIDFDYDPDTIPDSGDEYTIRTALTSALAYRVDHWTPHAGGSKLPVGVLFNFLVRAEDGNGLFDDNTIETMALAKTTPAVATNLITYNASGAPSGTNVTMTAGAPSASTIGLAASDSMMFISDVTITEDTTVTGLSFDVMVDNPNRSINSLTYELGYVDGSNAWVDSLGSVAPKPASIGKKVMRILKFALFSYSETLLGGNGYKLALRVTAGAGNTGTLDLYYGDAANKGVLMVNEQLFNHPTTSITPITLIEEATGGYVDITWSVGSDQDAGHTLHYDLFGSANGGTDYDYLIKTGVCFDGTTYDPDCTPSSGDETTTGIRWDTVGDGVGLGGLTDVTVKVAVGDGFQFEEPLGSGTFYNHKEFESAVMSPQLNNSSDTEAPAAVTTLGGETRPKQGSVYLSWTAVGNDGLNHGSRAAEYDIRFSQSPILVGGDPLDPGSLTNFNGIPETANLPAEGWAQGEPEPGFSGSAEHFELLGLEPEVDYYIVMRVGDESANWSGLSNEIVVTGGPKCGICHSTPPDESATAGTHAKHGYTMDDCSNCHGNDPSTGAQTYGLDHQDGKLVLGFKTANPVEGTPYLTGIEYNQGGTIIYQDGDGTGGFKGTGGDNQDDGSCMGFVGTGASGCHGSFSPDWFGGATPTCADCHGDKSTARDTDVYGRTWDDNTAGVPNDPVKASPPVDNHGNDPYLGDGVTPDPAATEPERIYVGAHRKHLNSSFRFAKGDSCRLCHKDYQTSGLHANGENDVVYDIGAGEGAGWTPEATGTDTAGTCGGTSADACHGPGALPKWDSAEVYGCNNCHGFGGANPDHVDATNNPSGDCTYCHVPGHPRSSDGVTPGDPNCVLIPNNPAVGIFYKSGGIHLKKTIGSNGTYSTEAEICWGCHANNSVSEWDQNISNNTGNSQYNYGTLSGTTNGNWIGATWHSGKEPTFAYKAGLIQSTHSTNPTGSSAVTGSAYGHSESPDTVDKLRCSNCHDVHNMNKAENDTMDGQPYLRGTWMGNPYEEDGAPWAKTYTNGINGYGAVPRGGTGTTELGGYFIDQNNVTPGTTDADKFPTSGWTLESSAGLCVLCHGADVNNMDQLTGEGLWLGTNGHSNSAIGGTFTNMENIFDFRHGRPVPIRNSGKNGETNTDVPSMGYQNFLDVTDGSTYGYMYRGVESTAAYTPNVAKSVYPYNTYAWGATVDDTSEDAMFHQFSCSKCHNPHASRLPKLMITNCLDIQHNSWDDGNPSQTWWNSNSGTGKYDYNKKTAYYATAQNCHRYDDQFKAYLDANPGETNTDGNTESPGGWNKVTPWTP